VKGRPQSGERRPLRHRLEVVDRFRGLYLDGAQELSPAIRRLEDQVWIPRRCSHNYRDGLLLTGVDGNFELSLVFRLKQANHPIVLQLLANGPHEDGAQRVLPGVCKPGEYSTRCGARLDG
jgi:hypothetical protein